MIIASMLDFMCAVMEVLSLIIRYSYVYLCVIFFSKLKGITQYTMHTLWTTLLPAFRRYRMFFIGVINWVLGIPTLIRFANIWYEMWHAINCPTIVFSVLRNCDSAIDFDWHMLRHQLFNNNNNNNTRGYFNFAFAGLKFVVGRLAAAVCCLWV